MHDLLRFVVRPLVAYLLITGAAYAATCPDNPNYEQLKDCKHDLYKVPMQKYKQWISQGKQPHRALTSCGTTGGDTAKGCYNSGGEGSVAPGGLRKPGTIPANNPPGGGGGGGGGGGFPFPGGGGGGGGGSVGVEVADPVCVAQEEDRLDPCTASLIASVGATVPINITYFPLCPADLFSCVTGLTAGVISGCITDEAEESCIAQGRVVGATVGITVPAF
jgi:hypothetical protein